MQRKRTKRVKYMVIGGEYTGNSLYAISTASFDLRYPLDRLHSMQSSVHKPSAPTAIFNLPSQRSLQEICWNLQIITSRPSNATLAASSASWDGAVVSTK